MKISIIVAMATNRVIGFNNKIPWHLSADLKKFKQITMGAPILMGRRTFESIGHPLPGRKNIIISRNLKYKQEGCLVFDSLEQAVVACQEENELFIIGGSSLYEAMLSQATVLYLTQIHKNFEGDTFFPMIDKSEWNEIARMDNNNDPTVDFHYSFITLERNEVTNES